MANIDLGITITGFNNATGAVRGASNDVKHLGENAQATANRLKAIQVVIAGILIDKTLEYSKAIVNAMASTQGLDLRMQAFAGSAKAADEVMSDLLNTFGAAPFKLDTISASWTRLRASVQSNDQVTPVLKAIVDDVAAMGGKDENINNLAQSFQRIFAVGTASAREYKTILQQTGLTLGDLAQQAGISATQFEKNLKSGFVSAQSFINDFVQASNARFGFFAQNLRGSIAGSISLVTNSISAGISHIGQTTDVNAHITGFFQNLAGAITKVMNSIDQKHIDKFFQWLADMEPLLVKTAVGLYNIAGAVLSVATTMGTLLAHLPSDTLEFGIIGYALMGKKGALLFMIMAGLDKYINNIANAIIRAGQEGNKKGPLHDFFEQEAKANKSSPLEQLANVLGENGGSTGKGSNPFASLLPGPEQIAAIKAQLEALMKGFKGGSAAQSGPSSQLEDALQNAANFAAKLNATLDQTQDKIAELNAKSNGDELGAELLQYNQQGDAFNKLLVTAQAEYDNLTQKTFAATDAINHMKNMQKTYNDALEVAKQKARELFNIETQQLQLQSMIAQTQNNAAMHQLAIAQNTGGGFNMLQGTMAGSALKQFQDQQVQYQSQILGYSQQINTLQEQINASAADPKRVAALEAQKNSYQQLQDATRNALQGLTVEGQMAQQFWQGVGQTLEGDVSNGISGLIKGTMTLGDVARSVFGDMISLAVKYLLQLVEMQVFGEVMATAAMAQTAAMGAAAAAIWGPAAMAASIATLGAADAVGATAYTAAMAASIIPFANGGVPGLSSFENSVVRGPTMFGMMGEGQDDEAVMPLTRIGGKLGVRAAGGGGETHIHIHAIDTQNGVEFITKHTGAIARALSHAQRLNKPV